MAKGEMVSISYGVVFSLVVGVSLSVFVDPFLDEQEAHNFLRRARRSNLHNLFEEFSPGNQERECVEETCSQEEAYEISDDLAIGREFWMKYQRCSRGPTFKSSGVPTMEEEAPIRVARQARRRGRSEGDKVLMRKCLDDTDQCTPFPCVRTNTESCEDAVDDYVCICKNGFEGRNCESAVDACLSNPCQNSGTCEAEIGEFACVCDSLHEGTFCEREIDDCRNNVDKSCGSHGRCEAQEEDSLYACECDEGYTGERCEQDIDECSNSPCDQTCTNVEGSYACSCKHGYLLDLDTMKSCRDIDECEEVSHGCEHSCHNTEGSYVCQCRRGYKLDEVYNRYCRDVDECATNNGGCSNIAGGCGRDRRPCETCHNFEGGFNCYCPNGFDMYVPGKDCQDVDECARDDHGCEHHCENLQGGYQCTCNEGYKLSFNGKKCLDVNECLSDHGCEYKCLNSEGSFHCTCNRGYTLGEDRRSCVDKDECTAGEVKCKQLCVNTIGSYKCDCRPGYSLSGKYRCSEINECASAPCGRNGRCFDKINSFRCECDDGFSGERCELDDNPCSGDPCQNGGTCIPSQSIFYCQCPNGYAGLRCMEKTITCGSGYKPQGGRCLDIDECLLDEPCDQICLNVPGSYTCACHDGYVKNGVLCQDEDECAENPCEQVCENSPGSYNCSCDEGFKLGEDGRSCEKTFSCFSRKIPTLTEDHLLVGTKKNDFVAETLESIDTSFTLDFEFRTFDPDGIILAMSDPISQRYLYITLQDGRINFVANLDGSQNKIGENLKTSASNSDGEWHNIVVKKKRNRIRVSKDGNRVGNLRFSRDRFGSVDKLYYGGIPSELVVLRSNILQNTANAPFQGCLRNFEHSGLSLVKSVASPEHSGCFKSIEKGMYFDGSGYISLYIRPTKPLRIRFSFNSEVPNAVILIIEGESGGHFVVSIQGDKLTATLSDPSGEAYSRTYTATNVDALCDDIWHVCDVTVSPSMVRLHVDGVQAQEEKPSEMSEVDFGENAILYLGGRSGVSNLFSGSLKNFLLNNLPLDVSRPLEIHGVRPYSAPLS